MIPSIRELELEEQVARLKRRIHELESKEAFTIDERALDLTVTHSNGTYALMPYITVKALRYAENPYDRTECFQAIWKCEREDEAMQVFYKADRVIYTRQAQDRIYDQMLRQALSHIIHR